MLCESPVLTLLLVASSLAVSEGSSNERESWCSLRCLWGSEGTGVPLTAQRENPTDMYEIPAVMVGVN